MKPQVLQNSLTKWENEMKALSDNVIPQMFKDIEDIQQNLMINLLEKSLLAAGNCTLRPKPETCIET